MEELTKKDLHKKNIHRGIYNKEIKELHPKKK